MEVGTTIRYSDERPCVVTISRPDGEVVFRIVTPLACVPQSVAEGLRGARQLFGAVPWPGRNLN